LAPYFPGGRTGGVGEFVAGLHERLRARGHESLVVTCGSTSTESVAAIASRPLGWFLRIAGWARRAREYDVVHVQAGEALPLVVRLRLSRTRPRILATFHLDYRGVASSFAPYRLDGRVYGRGLRPWSYRRFVAPLRRLLDLATLHLADAVNTISHQSAKDVLGPRASGARVIYNGIDVAADGGGRAEPPSELLYVGSGGPRKRVLALPFVLERVRESLPGARLRIVGFAPESEPELMRLLSEKGLGAHTEFAGIKLANELRPYYRASQVLLVPSAYEGLPFVILEAMRDGLPVVATRVAGHSEVVANGWNGYLVDVDRPDQMAARCCEILRDGALRRTLAANAAKTITDRFDVQREVDEYIDLYRRVLRAPNGRRNDFGALP
jgi:glycosyltransferase involved in cell wall biosynthesis